MISQQSAKYLSDLFKGPVFPQALAEVARLESEKEFEILRQAARVGDTLSAAMAEGRITTLEDFSSILKSYAAEYKVDRS